MRKVFALALCVGIAFTGFSQDKKVKVKEETKVQKTSTIPQKVHNTFSKHKHYSGKKVTHKKVVEKTQAK